MAEQPKKGKKDFPPRPPPGEGADSPSPEEQDPVSRVRPSQERRLPWHFMGLAGAETGCATFLLPAPCCGQSEGCCWGRAGAKVGAAGGRPRRRAGGGAATGGGVMTAMGRRGRMCPPASVRWRTAGQSSPLRRRRGLPGRSGSPGSGACRTHPYPPGPAIGHSWTTRVDIV